MKDVRDALMIGHRSDGTTVRRPLSPHLQVYKPQMTSVLSIMNRLSGIATSVGTLLMVWWLVAAAGSAGAYATMQGFVGSPVGFILLFGWTLGAGVPFCRWAAAFGVGRRLRLRPPAGLCQRLGGDHRDGGADRRNLDHWPGHLVTSCPS